MVHYLMENNMIPLVTIKGNDYTSKRAPRPAWIEMGQDIFLDTETTSRYFGKVDSISYHYGSDENVYSSLVPYALRVSTIDTATIEIKTRPCKMPSSLIFYNADDLRTLVRKVIFNGPATTVLFKDGTKETVKRMQGTKDDRETAIVWCIVKHLYPTHCRNRVHYYAELAMAAEKRTKIKNAKRAKKKLANKTTN